VAATKAVGSALYHFSQVNESFDTFADISEDFLEEPRARASSRKGPVYAEEYIDMFMGFIVGTYGAMRGWH
jgi:hypothetical protein